VRENKKVKQFYGQIILRLESSPVEAAAAAAAVAANYDEMLRLYDYTY
jgi:hypothetical protein